MIKSFQTDIIIRALGKKGAEELYDRYVAARKRSARTTPPTASQIRLANLGKEFGATVAAKKSGTQAYVVNNAITRVSRFNYLNGTKSYHA